MINSLSKPLRGDNACYPMASLRRSVDLPRRSKPAQPAAGIAAMSDVATLYGCGAHSASGVYSPTMLRQLLLAGVVTSTLIVTACGGDDGGAAGGEETNVEIGPAAEGIEGVMAIRVPDNTHTESPVDYGLSPPAGGVHNPVWLNCGFYDKASPAEHLVHDLEHGAVWLAYSPDLPAADINVIHNLARTSPRIVATPYPDLADGVAVVATAWARQLTLDSVADPRIEKFLDQYTDGDQAPEAGTTCLESPLGTPIP
ncbi:MAG: DUF3105 domain-containing protein [Acidimicrobiia bacterium]|nr:DUF3105 domain-containing protein [Acidimicrobiia bacterium]